MNSSASSIKPQEPPISTEGPSRTPSPTVAPTNTDNSIPNSQNQVSDGQLYEASQQSLSNKNQGLSEEPIESSVPTDASLLVISNSSQKSRPSTQKVLSINEIEVQNPGNNDQNKPVQQREPFVAPQLENCGVFPPWCFPFTLQCQPVPAGMICCAVGPSNASRRPLPPKEFNQAWNSCGPNDTMLANDSARNMNQIRELENTAEDFNLQSASGVLEVSNNWMQNSNRNPVPYPPQNIPPLDYQLASPFFMQYPCGSSFPYPVNIVCNPCQRTNQHDYQSKSMAGLQVPNYPNGLSMGLYQNGIEQTPKINQLGAQNQYCPYVCSINCSNGCNPAVGSSMQCSSNSQGVSRNGTQATHMHPQLQNQQPYMQSGLSNDIGCLNEYNNSFYYPENDQKCAPIPVMQCDHQEQDFQKPRQITLPKEMFDKEMHSCFVKHLLPCSLDSKTPGCNYTSCFCPWKSKKAFYCNGKLLCMKPKRQGEYISVEKPRGCIEPTSYVREFCVQGQNSTRGGQRFLQDGDITPGAEGLLPVSPDTETRLEIFNTDPNIYYRGGKKGLPKRMSKIPPVQQEDIYGANQNAHEDDKQSTSSLPFTKKT
ncbi:unnamed protein product [Allacma fusca]|uniref:Uncharacterized protein n=1 Tax=Allacma fusca TaxID=39272 RepID=A0A8J2KR94_9HEXA|nr:unnamed protein product [Allacma fusca]